MLSRHVPLVPVAVGLRVNNSLQQIVHSVFVGGPEAAPPGYMLGVLGYGALQAAAVMICHCCCLQCAVVTWLVPALLLPRRTL